MRERGTTESDVRRAWLGIVGESGSSSPHVFIHCELLLAGARLAPQFDWRGMPPPRLQSWFAEARARRGSLADGVPACLAHILS